MINITLEGGFATFYASVIGVIASQIELCEAIDDKSLHIGTNIGVFLINIEEFTINNIKFTTSTEAVTYILNN